MKLHSPAFAIRCEYCGRFVSVADLDSGKAGYRYVWGMWELDDVVHYHEVCRAKDDEKKQ